MHGTYATVISMDMIELGMGITNVCPLFNLPAGLERVGKRSDCRVFDDDDDDDSDGGGDDDDDDNDDNDNYYDNNNNIQGRC